MATSRYSTDSLVRRLEATARLVSIAPVRQTAVLAGLTMFRCKAAIFEPKFSLFAVSTLGVRVLKQFCSAAHDRISIVLDCTAWFGYAVNPSIA